MPRGTTTLLDAQAVDALAPSQRGFELALHVGVNGLLLRFGFYQIHRVHRAHQKVG